MPEKYIIGVCMLTLSIAAYAVPPKPQGGYIGLAAGGSELDDDGYFNDPAWGEFGFDVNLTDDEDSSFQLFGGYKFNSYFAIEGRYIDFGEFDVAITGTGPFVGTLRTDFEFEALSVHVIGILPLGKNGWELFGQLGLARMEIDIEGEDDDETVGSAGFGVRYYATENLAIGLQVDAYAWEEDDLPSDYDISLSTGQVSVSYIF